MNQTNFDNIHPFMEYPYKTTLSFDLLIEFWKEKAATPDSAEYLIAQLIMEKLKDAPGLYTSVDNIEELVASCRSERLHLREVDDDRGVDAGRL